jgi:hypothetical protein
MERGVRQSGPKTDPSYSSSSYSIIISWRLQIAQPVLSSEPSSHRVTFMLGFEHTGQML